MSFAEFNKNLLFKCEELRKGLESTGHSKHVLCMILGYEKWNIIFGYKTYKCETIALVCLSMLIVPDGPKEEKETFAWISRITYMT